MRKLLIALIALFSFACLHEERSWGYTVMAVYKNSPDTFYQMNRRPFTWDEAEAMAKEDMKSSNCIMSRPIEWDSVYYVVMRGKETEVEWYERNKFTRFNTIGGIYRHGGYNYSYVFSESGYMDSLAPDRPLEFDHDTIDRKQIRGEFHFHYNRKVFDQDSGKGYIFRKYQDTLPRKIHWSSATLRKFKIIYNKDSSITFEPK